MRKRLVLVWIILMLAGCNGKTGEVNITISAASSMMDSLWEVKEKFEKTNPDIHIYYNFGGSGSLRRQIDQGAPIDLFISASKKEYTNLLESKKALDGDAFLANTLVVVTPKDSTNSTIEELTLSNGKLAIGTPGAVPAGTYAKEALENMGIWEEFAGRTVYAKDARHVLTLVAEGSVQAGIVYASDVLKTDDVKIAVEIDPQYHRPIEYILMKIERHNRINQQEQQAINQFYNFLLTDSNLDLFEKYGFIVVAKEKLVND